MASTGWSCTSRPKVFFPGTSAWVITAWTPGIRAAAATSMDTIRACGCGLRSVAPKSMPSRRRSLAYSNWPLTLGTPSTRRTESPTPPLRRISTLMSELGHRDCFVSCPDHAGFAEVDQLSFVNHGFALDEEMLHRPGIAEHQRRDRVRLGPAVREAIDGEERDIGALTGLDRADVIASQAGRAAPRGNPQRIAGAHRRGPLARPRGQECLASFGEQVAAVIRRRTVDRETD